MHATLTLWKRAFQLSQKYTCRFLFAVLLLPALPTGLAAQLYFPFESITLADGLASNYVLCFFQDQQGFIWIGTENGLNRYDGRNFLEFRFDPEDPASLNSNWVSCLFEDSQQNIWIGTNTGLNRLNSTTGEIKRIPLWSREGKPVLNRIRSIYEDERQNIWVSTQPEGVYKLAAGSGKDDLRAEEFSIEKPDPVTTSGLDLPAPIYQKDNHLWLNTPRGLDRLDLRSGKVDRFPFPNPKYLSFGDQERVKTVWDGKDRLITSRTDSLFFLTPSEKEPKLRPLHNYFSAPLAQALPAGPFRHLVMDGPNKLLITRRSNLLQIDLTTGAYTYIQREDDPAADLSSVDITAVFRDRDGNIWLATDGNGILRTTRSRNPFRFYEHNPADPASISSGAVRTFAEDNGGGLWVGILNRGVDQFEFDPDNRLRRVSSLLHDPQQPNSLSDDEIIQIVKDPKGNLWIASNRGGINKIEPGTGRIETFMYDPGLPPANQLNENRIWALAADPDGQIWAGAWNQGLHRLDPETGKVKRYPAGAGSPRSPHSDKIRSLYLDQDSILWIGTEEGLGRMNIKTERFSYFVHDPDDRRSLSSNYVWVTCRDREGDLWVGTNVGLNRFDPDKGTFDRFYEKDGLPSNSIYGLLEDQYGALWISTENGLARKIASGSNTYFQAFTTNDGLGSVSFLPKAYFRNERTGELYFGTTDGLAVVAPALLQQNNRPPRLTLAAISILNPDANEGRPITDPFISAKRGNIVLTHLDRVVDFTLSDLSWNATGGFQFEYQLTGFDRQWMTLGATLKMRFTNLAPGKYTLQARSRTPDGKALEPVQLLTLKVLPPWWRSWWAYGLYMLLAGSMLYGFYRYQFARQLEKLETANLKALNEFKDTLYMNITHEFRTPLTVIQGMIEQVSGHEKIVELIRRNSANLLDLVNQILDLRKIELGKLKLEYIQADIVLYLRYIVDSYQALAELKAVQLHFIPREQEFFMDFDREKLLRIISNLLSNAIKFTPEGGHIYLDLKPSVEQQGRGQGVEMLYISVTDTGIGIPAEAQPFIFDRFYQVGKDQSGQDDPDASKASYQYRGAGGGTGIGLAMTKDLITLMGGRIDLVSNPGQGAIFTIQLPVSRQAPMTGLDDGPSAIDPLIAQPAETEQQSAWLATHYDHTQKTSLLIIEDNPDVRQYLISLLGKQYNLYLARDGQEGVDMALEHIPDLIISDVMMPGKDGFEVCSILKQDERTSHIPIILLTAKASVESRVQGLKRGADAYLAKPFNQEELFVRLEKLAELRRQLQARYQKLNAPLPHSDDHFQHEDAFMAKLLKAVENNLTDPDFGTTQLCKVMGMSRSQLHLKIKALTSRSTSNFVRAVRLNKARELFQTTDLNVNEVAYEVGFSDPSYFSRSFSEEFGINPKAFSSSVRPR